MNLHTSGCLFAKDASLRLNAELWVNTLKNASDSFVRRIVSFSHFKSPLILLLSFIELQGKTGSSIFLCGEQEIRVVGLAGLPAPAVFQLHTAVPKELLYDLGCQPLPDLREIRVVLPQHEPALTVAAEPSFLPFQYFRPAVRAGADHLVSVHQCVCSFHFFRVNHFFCVLDGYWLRTPPLTEPVRNAAA